MVKLVARGILLLAALALVAPGVAPPVVQASARVQAITAWRTYRDRAAGYKVIYPRSWKVMRSTASNGSVTTLMPRRGGTGITITVGPADANNPITSDIPSGHCQFIQQGGLTGARCFNTFSFTTYTVFFGANVTYTISVGKGGNLTVYNRVVKSFRLISG